MPLEGALYRATSDGGLFYKHVETLEKLTRPSAEFQLELTSDASKRDYIQEDTLVSSRWHQYHPYNSLVPIASADCSEDRCAVGCADF